MAIASDMVHAEIVDSQEFWKFSRKHKVGSIPTTLFNYQDSLIGVAEEPAVLERVIRRQ